MAFFYAKLSKSIEFASSLCTIQEALKTTNGLPKYHKQSRNPYKLIIL